MSAEILSPKGERTGRIIYTDLSNARFGGTDCDQVDWGDAILRDISGLEPQQDGGP